MIETVVFYATVSFILLSICLIVSLMLYAKTS